MPSYLSPAALLAKTSNLLGDSDITRPLSAKEGRESFNGGAQKGHHQLEEPRRCDGSKS